MPKRLMISAFLTTVLVPAFVAPTLARDTTRAYTCSQVQALVKQRGAVVLDTKNSSVYKRFVSSRKHCSLEEVTERYTVPTKSGSCRLKICIGRNPGGGG